HHYWKKEYGTKPQINKEGVIAKYGEEIGLERIKELESKFDNWKPGLNKWWAELRQNPWLEEWCKKNPNIVVYGEVIGGVKGFTYGCKPNERKIVVFDILKDGKFMDCKEAREFGKELNWVHDFYQDHPFNLPEIIKMVENMPNVSGNKFEEGIIVRSAKETWNRMSGRSIIKFKTPEYLEKS
ncbi:MAG TPA: RNA ligase family protein, partial [Nitrososphaeraceae archaeon]|nr:RNA ligase family protein [Nitrososphaeraceae archaeon]